MTTKPVSKTSTKTTKKTTTSTPVKATAAGPTPSKAPPTPTVSTPPRLSATAIASLTALVQELQDGLPTLPPMTPAEKSRTLKMRKGGAAVIPVVLSLANQYGLQTSLVASTELEGQAATLVAISDLETKLRVVEHTLANYRFALQASVWGTTSTLYSLLRRLSKSNLVLKNALANASQFFGYRTPAARAAHPKTAKGKAAKAAKGAHPNPPLTAPTAATPPAPTAALHS